MRRIALILPASFLALFILSFSTLAKERLVIPVSTNPADAQLYTSFIEGLTTPVEEVKRLPCSISSRPLASMVIIQQALAAGGLPVTFSFVEVPNSARLKMAVRTGNAVIANQELFSRAFTGDVFKSSEIIPRGKFVKGIYALPRNAPVMKIRDIRQLRKFRAVSCNNWVVDWSTLNWIEPAELRSVAREPLMFSLVEEGKVDFTLLEFPTSQDLSRTMNGTTLTPVPGVKVGLDDSRHFMISKQHPDGEKVFKALEKGLSVLRKKGRIKQFYTDVGFYNPRVADWKLINP